MCLFQFYMLIKKMEVPFKASLGYPLLVFISYSILHSNWISLRKHFAVVQLVSDYMLNMLADDHLICLHFNLLLC